MSMIEYKNWDPNDFLKNSLYLIIYLFGFLSGPFYFVLWLLRRITEASLKEDKGRSQIYFLAKRNSQYTKTQCPMNLKIGAWELPSLYLPSIFKASLSSTPITSQRPFRPGSLKSLRLFNKKNYGPEIVTRALGMNKAAIISKAFPQTHWLNF